MLTMGELMLIYDNYFDYLPLEKMPILFEQKKEEKKKYDEADDLLFIDDMD